MITAVDTNVLLDVLGADERYGTDSAASLRECGAGGRLVARKVAAEDPVEAVYGVIDLERGTDDAIDALRGPGDRT